MYSREANDLELREALDSLSERNLHPEILRAAEYGSAQDDTGGERVH